MGKEGNSIANATLSQLSYGPIREVYLTVLACIYNPDRVAATGSDGVVTPSLALLFGEKVSDDAFLVFVQADEAATDSE
ncbi:hypothetical protein DFR30_2163 [Thiogranum longum]|uniref:Uncharacterized protein n=1 Tax=Thiogranum longum TaxID=1537524 RepID=A0A4R1HBT8_9GAMM|nr:hypothetical protein DFR30_2163 [Thiogranum longum]